MSINDLSTVSSVASGDQIPVFDQSAGTNRKMSVSQLLAFFTANFASPDYDAVLVAPTSSGFNLQIDANTESIWLIVNPTGAFAAGTITLPPVAGCFDGQEIIVTCTEAIAALTVAGNGATVNGAPTALGTDGFFALRYNLLQTSWYCVAQSLGATNVFDNITVNTITVPSGGAIVGATSGESILGFTDTASAVNNLRIANKATGDAPTIVAAGADADIGIDIQPKNAGVVTINSVPVTTTTGAQTLTNKTLTAPVCDAIKMGGVGSSTVALLNFLYPPATSQGFRTVVVDSNATTAAGIGAVVAGGGANVVPVYCDGSDWRIG